MARTQWDELDPEQKEDRVIKRVDRDLRRLTPRSRIRVMKYLEDKYTEMLAIAPVQAPVDPRQLTIPGTSTIDASQVKNGEITEDLF